MQTKKSSHNKIIRHQEVIKPCTGFYILFTVLLTTFQVVASRTYYCSIYFAEAYSSTSRSSRGCGRKDQSIHFGKENRQWSRVVTLLDYLYIVSLRCRKSVAIRIRRNGKIESMTEACALGKFKSFTWWGVLQHISFSFGISVWKRPPI